MKIAVLGYGVVGSSVVSILDNLHHTNNQLEVVRILDLKEFDDPRLTKDFNDILNDPNIDTVVEVMGGYHPAYEFICACLKAKKNVVSANKAVIAKYFKEFNELAHQYHVQFKIEASVAGGIPWIKELQRILRMDTISSFSGIMNGTTNYILDNMHKNEVDFEDVLKEAQKLGYAEADPTADIEGFDIRNKCAISASIAYQGYVNVEDIPTFGISKIKKVDIDYFKSKNLTCKLLGQSKNYGDSISLFLCPVLTKNIEGYIQSNLNITSCTSNYLGTLQMIGQGAGGAPTASAIVSDILDIYEGIYSSFELKNELKIVNDDTYHFYVRMSKNTIIDEIALSYEENEQYVFIKTKRMTIVELLSIIENIDCFVAILED